MKRKIVVTTELRRYLKDTFKVTFRMITKALTYESKSELADKIRKLAIMKGGIETLELPAKDTIHDADGTMTQDLGAGFRLIADKQTGVVKVVTRKGHTVERRENPTLSELIEIQQRWGKK